jgi:hypothetical protein
MNAASALAKFAKDEIERVHSQGVRSVDTAKLIEWLGKLEASVTANERPQPLREFELEAYKYRTSASLESFRVIEIGNNALKTALGINGAASVALLAFIGHLATSSQTKALIAQLANPLLLFVSGVLAAALAMGVSYLTQSQFCHGHKTAARTTRMVAIAFVIASYICFALANYDAFTAFRSLH